MTVDAVGGVWQYAVDLGAALRPLGIAIDLALLGPAPTAAQREDLGEAGSLIDTGLELDWLASDAATVHAAGSAIAALAERLDVDLVHLNQPALAASATFAIPVVSTIHSCVETWWKAVHGGDAPTSFAWQTELVASGLRRSDAVVAPSAAFAETVWRTYALPVLPHVVPNGRRKPFGPSGMDNGVFTAGRLWDEGKNITLLDGVAARLDVPFRAAGATRAPRGESIVLRHIEALGPLDPLAMAARLSARPVFASAARYEPFGLAVLEAAAAGCALVLSDIATFRENWNGAATFVAPSDADGFVAAIETLLRDGELRMHRGEQASRRAAQFTPKRTAAGMHAIYEQALANRDVTVLTADA